MGRIVRTTDHLGREVCLQVEHYLTPAFDVREPAEQVCKIIGRLLTNLVDRNLMTLEQAAEIAGVPKGELEEW